ncbi:GDP-L-fucose synthase [Cichlidogyrus casuarinus]|uniref:GDP-L-fucose synthase n=1 Tax=Cichlidogyrus casuarinus TaxID=1844966 RepID=A0ABD2PRM7_9PLAT
MSANKEVVLVTGATGLVGNGIRLALESDYGAKYRKYEWLFVGSQQLNLLDKQATLAYFREKRPVYVIHLAARVGGLYSNMSDNNGFLLDNLNINLNVLDAAFQCKVKRLISCMTSCIFPDKITYPITEEKLHLGPPHDSNYGYAHAKRLLEVMSRSYNEKYNTQFVTVIPTNVFGPHDNYNLENAHVLPALIHKAYLAKQEKKPLLVAGSGKPLRQFIYSVDLGKLFLWTLFEYKDVSSIILSVPEADEISIADAARAIAHHMGLEQGIKITNEGADGQFKKTACNSKLMQLNPTFQFTPFDDAMKHACDWFVENYSVARK